MVCVNLCTDITDALFWYSSKREHETFAQRWPNVGPASQTLGQHQANVGQTSRDASRLPSLLTTHYLRYPQYNSSHNNHDNIRNNNIIHVNLYYELMKKVNFKISIDQTFLLVNTRKDVLIRSKWLRLSSVLMWLPERWIDQLILFS